jgi:hypothetical protein
VSRSGCNLRRDGDNLEREVGGRYAVGFQSGLVQYDLSMHL